MLSSSHSWDTSPFWDEQIEELIVHFSQCLNHFLDLPDLNALSVSWVSAITRYFPQNICPITPLLVVWYLNVLELASHYPIQWSRNLLHCSSFHWPTLVRSPYVESEYHFWSKGRLDGCTKHHSEVHLSSRYYKPNKLPNLVERTQSKSWWVMMRLGSEWYWGKLQHRTTILKEHHSHEATSAAGLRW